MGSDGEHIWGWLAHLNGGVDDEPRSGHDRDQVTERNVYGPDLGPHSGGCPAIVPTIPTPITGCSDQPVPRGVRIRLGLLMAYPAIPIDLIPDVIQVLGYADDAITVAAVRRHRPGSHDGFAASCRLTGIAGMSFPM